MKNMYVYIFASGLAMLITGSLMMQPPDHALMGLPDVTAANVPVVPMESIRRPALEKIVPPNLTDIPEDSTLAFELQKIAASGDPVEAFRGYGMIKRCMELEKTGAFYIEDVSIQRVNGNVNVRIASSDEIGRISKFCSSLTEVVKRSRLDLLSAAAAAGVPDADVSFMVEGPFGDPTALETRPDDQLVIEWRRKALSLIQENANKGVISSIKILQISYSYGALLYEKQPLQALTYGYVLEGLASANVKGLDDIEVFSESVRKIRAEHPEEDTRARTEADKIVQSIKRHTPKNI